MVVPFLEPRSATAKPAAVGVTVQWRDDTEASVSGTSQPRSAPITTPIGGRSASMPASGPASTRSRDERAPACMPTWLVTRVTRTLDRPDDAAPQEVGEVPASFEPTHAGDVEDL